MQTLLLKLICVCWCTGVLGRIVSSDNRKRVISYSSGFGPGGYNDSPAGQQHNKQPPMHQDNTYNNDDNDNNSNNNTPERQPRIPPDLDRNKCEKIWEVLEEILRKYESTKRRLPARKRETLDEKYKLLKVYDRICTELFHRPR